MDFLDEPNTRLERPVEFSILAALLSLTAISTVLFWALLPPIGMSEQTSLSYLTWRRAFSLAEAWMVLTAIAAAIGLLWLKDWGLLFGCLAGSSLIFLGLADVLFCLQQHVYESLTAGSLIEASIHLWFLVFGSFIIAYLWGKRKWFVF
ncbi:MAG: hypothetical protein KKA73_12180 [Chloroflexi bacterium]|nr:hypothetical protein [Chloroflexota bacterium]MBU1748439.1 hypothetical protein [Chloroflexota bacterium]MBU1877728.1 hypothetical protein [Chloroflexota bacterium]